MKLKIRFVLLSMMLLGGLWAATTKVMGYNPLHKLMNHPIMGEILQSFSKISKSTEGEKLYLHIDKPIVEPGDDIWFTAYLRNGNSLKPSHQSDIIHVELINPKGAKEKEIHLIAHKGIANGDFMIDEDMPGGIYKIKAYTQYQNNDSSFFEKEIQVQDLIAPDVLVNFKFNKSSYGAGESASFEFDLKNQQQKTISTNITIELLIDGKVVSNSVLVSKSEGSNSTNVQLPTKLASGNALVKLSWNVDGLADSYSRNIPLVLSNVKVSFFPEGGDAIIGIPNRIAYRVTDLQQKAADISAKIIVNGKEINETSTYHQGRGTFTITPNNNDNIIFRVYKPFKQDIPVNLALTDVGYSMQLNSFANDKLKITIHSNIQDSVYLTANCRNTIVYSDSKWIKKGKNEFEISTATLPVGIHQITLFDSKGIERNERLVFLNKNRKLNIDIATDKKQYQPREKVKGTITIKDERGMPVPGAISISVVKESLFQEVKNNPSTILTSFLLEQELKSKIEEPGFYFNAKEIKADTALDMLLLTEGWRRFTWEEIRNEEISAFAIQAEKAIIFGRIIEAYSGQPINGALLYHQDKIIGKSDSLGRYQIKNLPLYEPVSILVKHKSGNSMLSLSAYGNAGDFYLYSDDMLYKYDAVPMMDMAEVERGGIERNVRGANQIPMAAKKEILANEEIAPIRKAKALPLEKEIDKKPENKIVAKPQGLIRNNELGEVDDEIVMNKGRMKRIARPQPATVQYYRARVFEVKTPPSFSEMPRSDFRNTIFWSGGIQVDKTGKANFEFYNSDDVASFRITTEGISMDGLIGHEEKKYSTLLPISMKAIIPGELTEGDNLEIPVLIKNNTALNQNTTIEIAVPTNLSTANKSVPVSILPNENKTVYLKFNAIQSGKSKLGLSIKVGEFSDEMNEVVNVISKGFPYEVSISGKEKNKEFTFDMTNVVKGSAYTTFSAYPDVVSDLMKGVESIIREPYGCFEQTSTSNYPNVMAKLYLQESGTTSDKEGYLNQVLDKGYKRLTSYETKTNGYEWFGSTPAHEALTAYGLMQFNDMQRVYSDVDPQMVKRTADWLFSRRDGKGGFQRSAQALDEFGRADDQINNAYIVYALSEAGFKDIKKELETSEEVAKKGQDPYILAMIAQAFYNLNEPVKGNVLLEILMKKQQQDGSWAGSKHSITRSEGLSLKVETTSLAVMAMLKSKNPDMKSLEAGIKFILSSRSGYGGFGSTQGTILALKALTQYATFMKQTKESGNIEIRINGQLAGTKSYEAGERNAITLEGMEKYLQEGKNKISIKYVGVSNPLPFSMAIGWNTTEPASDDNCKVNLTTQLVSSKVKNSDVVRLSCTLTNKTTEGLPMTMAEIGLPAGTQAQAWQLKELQDKKEVDFFEIKGNRVILYYRQMKPSEVKTVHLELKAAIPGKYESQASSAYLYYTPEFKKWVKPMNIVIAP